MSVKISECFDIINVLTEKLSAIKNHLNNENEKLKEREDRLNSKLTEIKEKQAELDSYSKVSMYNMLNKKVHALESENKLLKRSKELINRFEKKTDKQSIDIIDSNGIRKSERENSIKSSESERENSIKSSESERENSIKSF